MPKVPGSHSSRRFGVEFPRSAAPFEKAATKKRGHRSGHRLLFPSNVLPSDYLVVWLHLRDRFGAPAWGCTIAEPMLQPARTWFLCHILWI